MEFTFSHAIFLGIVQGLSEFLPISSSGHLVLVPWLFRFSDPGLAFDVALHMGTLIAVVSYFWRDWFNIFRLRTDMQEYNDNTRILWLLVAATIPGVLAGLLLEKQAETVFRHPLLIAFTLSSVGLILFLTDKYFSHRKHFHDITIRDALFIGACQAFAIVPGVSRSGATIIAGLLRGLDRVTAARFSFLLSTPIIFGASLFTVRDLLQEGITGTIVIGTAAAAVSGYIAIASLLRFVKRSNYAVFFWYRLALAIVIGAVFVARFL